MLKTETINGVIVASFDNINNFNAVITEPVKEQLKGYFNEPNTKLVLDLNGIKFVDSSGFGVFLSTMKTANSNGGQFKICNVSNEVYELFKLLQLHNVFSLYNSREECIASFDQK